ncbi:hypothetical protein VFPFJ_06365 [Purpureocillium lilacinum]|uniref:Uncharacterized protein n=2 Tax=Purpureocillium lilacinum TaxID=33203 RepID=A0A179HK71_PURLI|nr:hypothetical protein VFPFJ_06365 [Purpureocillium lilacinum]KAK4091022.1 hypothetical protein Purlil1_4602 [Purpureocillium lilacinum]OAQ87897.1 hypothetical protein VFPBJ_01938 [Purpureocillium lilacinum]OAQ89951.1 hypothetical protein VFPFJ_06365 [Purpureocillium lilacinum]PWI68447.1 hypothetical protein PCL_02216 [Purpureocillium lilacinum]GJN69626.1 hypothetical protein PLICBS_003675 [Purpureocillium lilacinum]
MPGSPASSGAAPSSAPTTAQPAAPATFGDNKGIKFHIKTGNSRWACTLQDRSAYERMKAARTNSMDSADSSASSTTS